MSEFTVTHVAPAEGLQAWHAPDPSVPAVADVQAGVQLQLLERRGAWARVLFSNGWAAWVDGRRLVDAARPEPPPAVVGPAAPAPVVGPAAPAAGGEPGPAVADEPVPAQLVWDEPERERPVWGEPEPAVADEPVRAAADEPVGRAEGGPVGPVGPAAGGEPERPVWGEPVWDEPERERPVWGEPAEAVKPAGAGERAGAPSRPDPLDDPFAGLEADLRPEPVPAPARRDPRPEAGRDGEPTGGDERRLGFDPASVRPIPALVGAGAVLLGTFFAWITIDDADGNAYDVPLAFLVNHRSASGDGLKVGLVMLALAGAVAALCFLPGKVRARRILGGAVLAVTLVYAVQLQRALSEAGDGAPGLISALGFGVLLSLVGGAAIVYDPEDSALRE